MPLAKKAAKGQVTFALAIVKSSVIRNRAESARIRAAVEVLFPGVSVILVAEDDALESHRRRPDLFDFADDAACAVIASSRITCN